MTTRRQCKIQYTVSYHFFLPPVTICLFSPQSYKKKATTTNVMFFFHFTPHGFLYCHVSHNLLFSNISQYLLTYLPIFFSHVFQYSFHISHACVIQWHLPDLSLTLPCGSPSLFPSFPHQFPPSFSPSIFRHSSHTQRYSMTPPRPFPDFTLWVPRTFLAFPHHLPPSFLVNFLPFLPHTTLFQCHLPDLSLTLPCGSLSLFPSFLVNFPPFPTPLKHYRIVIC